VFREAILENKDNHKDMSSDWYGSNVESDHEEGGVDELVRRVFTPMPQPPHSIQLELLNAASTTTSHAIFQTLGQLLTHGIVYLYGTNVNIEDVNIKRLQQYLASVGWRAIVNPSSAYQYPKALPYLLYITLQNKSIKVAFEPLY
jgi:hypothetical protein